MAWCRQATSHYLNQCWPRFPTPYSITHDKFSVYYMSKNIHSLFIKWQAHHPFNKSLFNTLRPEQNGWHFADEIFKGIYLNENNFIMIQISLKVVYTWGFTWTKFDKGLCCHLVSLGHNELNNYWLINSVSEIAFSWTKYIPLQFSVVWWVINAS